MISCPHCDRHVRPPALERPFPFPCPMCEETVDLVTEPGRPARTRLAIGVGVGLVVAGAMVLSGCPSKENLPQPAYGVVDPGQLVEPPALAPPAVPVTTDAGAEGSG